DDGKKKHGRNCELKSAAAFDPFSVCNVIDALQYGSITFWVTGIDTSLCCYKHPTDSANFSSRVTLFKTLSRESSEGRDALQFGLTVVSGAAVTFHWTLCQCFVLPTFQFLQSISLRKALVEWTFPLSPVQCYFQEACSNFVNFKIFSKSFESVPASDELTNGWKSLLSSMLPKILPEKTADMVRTVVDMVKLVNTSQPTSNEEHFNEAAAVTKSITVDETIIRVPARSPSVMEQSLGLLRPFFGSIDPWRAILYRDPPLLSVDLADGDSQENDMTRSTLSLDSFKSNFFKSTNHDSQLLDELETEPVAAKRPVDYFNYYYNS
ncbi:DNA mismatch repair protein MutS, partial [Trichinella spiralis]